jgi:hypothetical protein
MNQRQQPVIQIRQSMIRSQPAMVITGKIGSIADQFTIRSHHITISLRPFTVHNRLNCFHYRKALNFFQPAMNQRQQPVIHISQAMIQSYQAMVVINMSFPLRDAFVLFFFNQHLVSLTLSTRQPVNPST